MKTLDTWVDVSMREMRQKYRDMFNSWVGNDISEMIEKAEDLQKNLKAFIDYLKRKDGS
jgi:hypothetical protein